MVKNPQVSVHRRPIVLVFSGHDPSGGAGVQADIESISQCGCHAMTIITLLSTQTPCEVLGYYSQARIPFAEQTKALLQTTSPSAIKIGALADLDQIAIISENLEQYPSIPLILDPVIAPTQGVGFADQASIDAIKKTILPKTWLFTPNLNELIRYTGITEYTLAAKTILDMGCQNILLTSAISTDNQQSHFLFKQTETQQYQTPKLWGEYRGTGCILSASIAAYLAQGVQLEQALQLAQDYVLQTLIQADPIKAHRFLPNRMVG